MKKLLLAFSFVVSLDGVSQLYGWDNNAYLPGLGRDDAVCFTLDQIVFIGTGNHGGFSESNTFYSFNTRSGTWQDVAHFPGIPRQYALVEEVGFKAFLIGGIDAFGNALNDVWEYDLKSDSWNQQENFPGEPRWKAASFSVNGIIYYGTGKTTTTSLNDFWKFDPETKKWTQLSDLPIYPRNETVAFSLYNEGYIGLGVDCTGVLQQDFWKYIPEAEEWEEETNFPGGPRYYAAAEVINGYAYVGTGEDEMGNMYNDFWRYDPATKMWKQAENLPFPKRRGVATCSIPFKGIYFACGLDENFQRLTDISQYTNRNLNPPPLNVFFSSDQKVVYINDLPNYAVIQVVDLSGNLMFETYDYLDHLSVSTVNWAKGVYIVWVNGQAEKFICF